MAASDLRSRLETRRDAVEAAYLRALEVQRYQVGSRSKDNAEFDALARELRNLDKQIEELGGIASSAASLAEFGRPT